MISFYQLRLLTKEILENCDECGSEKEQRMEKKKEEKEDKMANAKSWVWLIEKVENRPLSEIICLIPKIHHYGLFCDIGDIGKKIFGFLEFKDLNNCYTVCKGWHNFLKAKRTLWIQLLEKEKIKLDKYNVDFDWDKDLSDCSSDDSWSSDGIWRSHFYKHDPYNMVNIRGRNPKDMSRESAELFNDGYVQFCPNPFLKDKTKTYFF